MATMTKFRTLREAQRAAKESLRDARDGESVYVLRRDGDTDRYLAHKFGVTHVRTAGHTTLGLWVDSSELPCIIC